MTYVEAAGGVPRGEVLALVSGILAEWEEATGLRGEELASARSYDVAADIRASVVEAGLPVVTGLGAVQDPDLGDVRTAVSLDGLFYDPTRPEGVADMDDLGPLVSPEGVFEP